MLERLVTKISNFLTKPIVFAICTVLAVIWVVSGFLMEWSDLWNKIMDIPTTLLSFLFFFVIIAGNNSDDIAVQAKLDEIISVLPKARNELEHIEEEDSKTIQEKRI